MYISKNRTYATHAQRNQTTKPLRVLSVVSAHQFWNCKRNGQRYIAVRAFTAITCDAWWCHGALCSVSAHAPCHMKFRFGECDYSPFGDEIARAHRYIRGLELLYTYVHICSIHVQNDRSGVFQASGGCCSQSCCWTAQFDTQSEPPAGLPAALSTQTAAHTCHMHSCTNINITETSPEFMKVLP